MKTLILLCLSCISPLLVSAQNLIPNGSFERTKKQANQWISGSREDFNQQAKFWYSPTNASPDLYRVAADNDKYPPNFRLINPPTGTGMAGLILSTQKEGIGCIFYKEYLQIKLKDTLTIGKQYELEFWMSAKTSGIHEIGVLFSEEPIHSDRCGVLEEQPQFTFRDTMLAETWQRISYQFKPGGLPTYLTIGSFSTTDYKKSSYCYLDDFQLKEVQPTLVKKKELATTAPPTTQPIIQLPAPEIFNPANIQFEHGKATLTTATYSELDKLVSYLDQNKSLQILIEGHTDNAGTTAENQTLSENRAKAVKVYLVSKGIPTINLTTIGYGETQPIEDNEKEAGRARNRRVVFKVQK